MKNSWDQILNKWIRCYFIVFDSQFVILISILFFSRMSHNIMQKNKLSIFKSKTSRKRAKMGSETNSVESYDNISRTHVNVMTLDSKLEPSVKRMIMFESIIPIHYAAYLFAKKASTDELHDKQFLDKINAVDQRYLFDLYF